MHKLKVTEKNKLLLWHNFRECIAKIQEAAFFFSMNTEC